MSEAHNYWNELRIIQDTYTKIWQIYMSWYTWFLGFNLLAMSWIISSNTVRGDLAIALAILMVFFLFLGVTTSIIMGWYSNKVTKKILSIKSGPGGNDSTAPVFLIGAPIMKYAAIATAATQVANIVAWVYLANHFGFISAT